MHWAPGDANLPVADRRHPGWPELVRGGPRPPRRGEGLPPALRRRTGPSGAPRGAWLPPHRRLGWDDAQGHGPSQRGRGWTWGRTLARARSFPRRNESPPKGFTEGAVSRSETLEAVPLPRLPSDSSTSPRSLAEVRGVAKTPEKATSVFGLTVLRLFVFFSYV